MNRWHASCLGLVSLAMLSCSSVAPVKVALGDQCFRCRRSVADVRVAAETIDGNRFTSKFRGPGCLAKYLVAHADDKVTIFVTDYTGGKMMPPERAFYVQEIVNRNTNETDYRAYREQADADAAAAALHTTPLAWDAVLDKAR